MADLTQLQTSLPSNIVLSEFSLRPLSDDSYTTTTRDLGTLVGAESRTQAYQEAVHLIAHRYALPLDSIDQRWLTLMLTAVSRATRFDGSLHLGKAGRENTGVHTVMCVAKLHEAFRLAGLDQPKYQQDSGTVALRLALSMALLHHDLGEWAGELSSEDQRSRNPNYRRDPHIEGEIFTYAARLALWAIEQESPATYFREQQELMTIVQRERQQECPSTAPVRHWISAHGSPSLSADAEARLARYIAAFNLAEGASGFVHYFVKVLEHNQGTRHMNREGAKHPMYRGISVLHADSPEQLGNRGVYRAAQNPPHTIPMAYGEQVRLRSVLNFTLRGLGEVFQHATHPSERRLAAILRDMVFATILEALQSSLYVWDRNAARSSEFVRQRVGRLDNELAPTSERDIEATAIRDFLIHEQRQLLRLRPSQGDRKRNDLGETLPPLVTRAHLVHLFARALELAYIPLPGKEVLGVSDAIPVELRGHRPHENRFTAILHARDAMRQRHRPNAPLA